VAGLGLADPGLPAFRLGNPGLDGRGLHCLWLAASGLAATGRSRLGANDSRSGIGLHSLGLGGTGLASTRPASGLLRDGPHGTRPGRTCLRGTGFARTGRLSLWERAEQGGRFLLTGAGLVLRRKALVPRATVARSLTLVGWLLRSARERYDTGLLDCCQLDGSGGLALLPGLGRRRNATGLASPATLVGVRQARIKLGLPAITAVLRA
jgi:hypothetical protein